ncbi:AMP-binding protein [Candidatus Gracilibacteria bacterium]|nr:AMP-binding protein [Candidatus Gracilibacteria bacterium]
MYLPDWLARRAALAPAAPALIYGNETVSFGELDRATSTMAAWLRAHGIAPGERVAVLLRNCIEFALLVHAMPRCGAILVPLNTRLSAPELAFQIADVGARLLLYDAAHAELAQESGVRSQESGVRSQQPEEAGLALRRIISWKQCIEAEHSDFWLLTSVFSPPIDLDAIHCIIYTSGTTGRPKGALLSYGNHWWSATASALNLGLRVDAEVRSQESGVRSGSAAERDSLSEGIATASSRSGGDRWLAFLPLFHIGGMAILLRGAIYGMPVVLHERFDAAAANAAIDAGVTIVSVVATTLQRMFETRGAHPYPPHFRCALLGGGPAPKSLLEASAARGVPVAQTYGMTETASQAATLAPTDALRKLGSAGQPLLPLELRIADETGVLPSGQVGEIRLRGPMVCQGYWARPEATAAALQQGWLHTGDLGYLDDDGYLFVVDRRDDLIIAGGENIYPAEVEAVLLAHPLVVEAGVIGVRDAQWGAVPVAVVVLRNGERLNNVQEEAMRDWCRARLAAYKVPRRILTRDELPRTASGKLRRNMLREENSERRTENSEPRTQNQELRTENRSVQRVRHSDSGLLTPNSCYSGVSERTIISSRSIGVTAGACVWVLLVQGLRSSR